MLVTVEMVHIDDRIPKVIGRMCVTKQPDVGIYIVSLTGYEGHHVAERQELRPPLVQYPSFWQQIRAVLENVK